MTQPSATSDVLVVGGGVIGLAIAWRAAQRGLRVTVLDPAPGSGASHAAGGMLAPVTEVHYGEVPLLQLNLASAARYADFAAELTKASGLDVGYRQGGTLSVAFDTDDKATLDDLAAYQDSLGLKAEALSSRECRRLEPMLSPSVRGGLLVHDDHQVDNRRLVTALLAACTAAGVDLIAESGGHLDVDGGRAVGVDGRRATTVVLAAGCWSAELAGLPDDAIPPVRPVKGQILRLRTPAAYPLLGRTVRAVVRGNPVYLVPRTDGEIVLGATTEEMGFDTRVTAGAVYEILRDAHELVPGLAECELVESIARLRPGSPDNAPLIGTTSLDGLVAATGHYRNGILLAPVTADTVADLLATGRTDDLIAAFSPRRFTPGAPA